MFNTREHWISRSYKKKKKIKSPENSNKSWLSYSPQIQIVLDFHPKFVQTCLSKLNSPNSSNRSPFLNQFPTKLLNKRHTMFSKTELYPLKFETKIGSSPYSLARGWITRNNGPRCLTLSCGSRLNTGRRKEEPLSSFETNNGGCLPSGAVQSCNGQ